MKENLNREEQAFKDKLEELEFAYQESDWLQIKDQLGGANPSVFQKYGKGLAIAVSGLALVGVGYFALVEEKTTPLRQTEKQKVEMPAPAKKQEGKSSKGRAPDSIANNPYQARG